MASLADANIFDTAAFKRAKLGATLVITAMGVPMIWMGEEFGEYKHKTLDPAPLDWRLLDNDPNAGTASTLSRTHQPKKTERSLMR